MKEEAKRHFLNTYFVDPQNTGLLLIGSDAKSWLSELKGAASYMGFDTRCLQCSPNPKEFWTGFISGINPDETYSKEALDYMVNCSDPVPLLLFSQKLLVERNARHHLFIPDADVLFYRLDVAQKGCSAKYLKALWFPKENKLSLYVSAKSKHSREYVHTFGREFFPLHETDFNSFVIR